ncbi:hypothetical protein [Indioceanicola profundi]|uniref:hypothetical protein n=1 Tax=Indioceanicola profundi TaxID=2220096 RepID=UPI000E6ACF53|nr:hypothetical protein [Indioceanicola profundi]
MFRSDNKIGFRFGREPEEAGDNAEDRQSALKSAMQASTQRSGLPAPRPVTGETLPPVAAAPIPAIPGFRPRPSETRPTEDSMLPTSTIRADERAAQPVIAQARAIIGQVQSDEDARALETVLKTIDTIAARQMDFERELRLARDTAAKATADRARLQEENQQMRDLLSSLLKTVETERRRRSDAVGRIGDRLKSLAVTLGEQPAEKTEAA